MHYQRLERERDLPEAIVASTSAGAGIGLIEVRADRAGGARLRHAITATATWAAAATVGDRQAT